MHSLSHCCHDSRGKVEACRTQVQMSIEAKIPSMLGFCLEVNVQCTDLSCGSQNKVIFFIVVLFLSIHHLGPEIYVEITCSLGKKSKYWFCCNQSVSLCYKSYYGRITLRRTPLCHTPNAIRLMPYAVCCYQWREAYARNYDARWLSTTVKMFYNSDLPTYGRRLRP